MKTFTATHLDNGFYLVSDAAAGALVGVIGHKLPKLGYEKFVMVKTADGRALNAWLIRTDVRHSCRAGVTNARGWRWAVHGLRAGQVVQTNHAGGPRLPYGALRGQ